MLFRHMVVGVGDFGGKHQAVLSPFGFPQSFKLLLTNHLAQGIRCIDRAVNHDVGDVDTLAGEFRVQ